MSCRAPSAPVTGTGDPLQVDRRERWFIEGAVALRRTLTTTDQTVGDLTIRGNVGVVDQSDAR
jgi:hypothetical protein